MYDGGLFCWVSLKSKQEHLTMENSSFKQLVSCVCFFLYHDGVFNKGKVVNERRGFSEILQLCWNTSSCFGSL